MSEEEEEKEMLSRLLQWDTFSHLEGYVLIWLGGSKKGIVVGEKRSFVSRRHFWVNVKPFCPTDCKGLLNRIIWQRVDVVALVVVVVVVAAVVVMKVLYFSNSV